VIKYRSGTIYNQRHAVRFKQSNSLRCSICSCQDSALHILSGCQHPIIRNMVTKRHDIAGRLITKAISKGSLGSCLVSTDVGSANKHRMQNLQQIPATAEFRVSPAWIFAINHNRRDRLTSCPDATLVNPKKTRKINSQNQQNHPNDQGPTSRSGRRWKEVKGLFFLIDVRSLFCCLHSFSILFFSWITFCLSKTSHKPISLMARLAVY